MPEGARILLVEDESGLADTVRYGLEREGFVVEIAADGQHAIESFRSEEPAMVLLDVMLPRLSGLDVLRIIRAESTVPIVMLTAKDAEADKVAALEIGADDYVTKPFSMRELVSRMRAHLRRAGMTSAPNDGEVIRRGAVELDVARHEVRVRGERVALTPKEFQLLHTFMIGKGRLRTRSFLISEVWGHDYFGDTKTLDVHVKRLREKIESDPHNPQYLVTVRGLGYRFLDAPDGC